MTTPQKQFFGSALACPWALVKWNASSTPGRRPSTTIAYITDACGDHYLGGVVEFYRKRDEPAMRWHFRFNRPRKFARDAVVSFFPNGKSQGDGPSVVQIRAAKKAVPKNPELTERCPTCAEPVASVFDHVDKDCEHT